MPDIKFGEDPITEQVSLEKYIFNIRGEINELTPTYLLNFFTYFKNDNRKKSTPIIRVTSPGGDLFSALAIVDILNTDLVKKINPTIEIWGQAHSGMALAVISCPGKRLMSKHSYMMIHDIYNTDSRKYENDINIKEALIKIILSNSKISEEDLRQVFSEGNSGKYMNYEKCLNFGFVDGPVEGSY